MEREHETMVRFAVEVQRKHRNGWEKWFSTPNTVNAEQVIEKLRADGLTARIVKETTTTVREVLE